MSSNQANAASNQTSLNINGTREEEAICRICRASDQAGMLQPCNCLGSIANVHFACIKRWIEISGRTACSICGTAIYTGIRIVRKRPSFWCYWKKNVRLHWFLSYPTAFMVLAFMTSVFCVISSIQINSQGLDHQNIVRFSMYTALAGFHAFVVAFCLRETHDDLMTEYNYWAIRNLVTKVEAV